MHPSFTGLSTASGDKQALALHPCRMFRVSPTRGLPSCRTTFVSTASAWAWLPVSNVPSAPRWRQWPMDAALRRWAGRWSAYRDQVQGPFHGPAMAESVLQAIADNLVGQGYRESDDPSIWQLHMQAELRRVNANQGASSAAGNDRHSIIDVRPSGADLPVTARLCPAATMTLCLPWSARPCCVYSRLVQLPL